MHKYVNLGMIIVFKILILLQILMSVSSTYVILMLTALMSMVVLSVLAMMVSLEMESLVLVCL